MDFDVIDISIKVYAPDKPALCRQFPHLGSQFASACRSTVCDALFQDCGCCKERQQCEWHYVFSQSYSNDALVLKRYQKPALPFAFSFPWFSEGISGDPAGEVDFRLTVLGRAVASLEMLLSGFELMADSAVFAGCRVASIGSRDLQGDVKPLYQEKTGLRQGGLTVLSSCWIFDNCGYDGSSLEVFLQSPLKLVSEGKPAYDFNFAHFARSVMRRVSSLAYYYCDYEFDVDYVELSQKLSDVVCTRDSYLFSNHSKLSGVTGSGAFEGEFDGILPFLRLGSYFNIGKMSAFGMGNYSIR